MTSLKIYYLAERKRAECGIYVVKNLRKISRHRTELYFATNKNVDVMFLADHSRNFMEFLAPNWWLVAWFPKGDGSGDRYLEWTQLTVVFGHPSVWSYTQ